jgi:hypothetical protein
LSARFRCRGQSGRPPGPRCAPGPPARGPLIHHAGATTPPPHRRLTLSREGARPKKTPAEKDAPPKKRRPSYSARWHRRLRMGTQKPHQSAAAPPRDRMPYSMNVPAMSLELHERDIHAV